MLFYLIECSFIDLGLLPLFMAGVFLLKKERWILSGIIFGLAAGSKQYAFLPLVFSSVATFFFDLATSWGHNFHCGHGNVHSDDLALAVP